MGKKITVGILFGGKSAEHEVSLQSAKNVTDAIDRSKYEPVQIKIDKDGSWSRPFNDLAVDVVFPILHGPFGEDGTVQGLLKLAEIPFVGAGVLASAAAMDKDVMKRLLREAGLPIGKFRSLLSGDKIPDYEELVSELGSPLFIKPANMGSSVGISKVCSKDEYQGALNEAFKYDCKIVIEEFIPGRELECSVLGSPHSVIEASVVGEIKPSHDFYSYDAKYIDDKGAELIIPAGIPAETSLRLREIAIEAFKTLCCEGLARVDFFLKEDGGIIVNEINTMPGFTRISMYPKLWEASGLSYTRLIDRLIELALGRFEKEKSLKTSV